MNELNKELHDCFRKIGILERRPMIKGPNPADTQNRILSILSLNDNGISQRQLSNILGTRPQSTGEVLVKMEQNSLIRRETDENDNRINLVYLTGDGKKRAQLLNENTEEHPDIFDCLTEEEKASLLQMLNIVLSSVPEFPMDKHPEFSGQRFPEEGFRNLNQRGPSHPEGFPNHHGHHGPHGQRPDEDHKPFEDDNSEEV